MLIHKPPRPGKPYIGYIALFKLSGRYLNNTTKCGASALDRALKKQNGVSLEMILRLLIIIRSQPWEPTLLCNKIIRVRVI